MMKCMNERELKTAFVVSRVLSSDAREEKTKSSHNEDGTRGFKCWILWLIVHVC